MLFYNVLLHPTLLYLTDTVAVDLPYLDEIVPICHCILSFWVIFTELQFHLRKGQFDPGTICLINLTFLVVGTEVAATFFTLSLKEASSPPSNL